MSARAALRAVAGSVLPRHRAWSTLLESLTLDPERMARPVAPPGGRDFMICGSPRSGTALLVAMLYRPPSVVTVMEPWDALRLPPSDLFASLRTEIRSTGRLGRGRLDIDALEQEGAVRWCRDGERPHHVATADDFQLGVKFPAFWRYLELLPDTRFLVCLRNPSEVVQSYAGTGGRLRQGLDYDVPFNRAMNEHLRDATDDIALRRVLMYDYIHQRILPHLGRANVLAVRYERWFEDPDGQIADIAGFLGVEPHRSHVALRPPASHDVLDMVDRELLRRHCSTAAALGYEV